MSARLTGDRPVLVHATMLEHMRRQTEDVIRYYGEINRRVGQVGLEGVPGLLEVTHQVEAALSTVAPQEIEWIVAELRRLLEQLVRIDSQLQRLRELKMHLEEATPSEIPGRRSSNL